MITVEKVMLRHPNRVPVYIDRKPGVTDVPELERHKYLVPKDMTVGAFMYIIRKNIKLTPEKAIFIFVNNTLPPTFALIGSLYNQHKDKDGYMRIYYTGENTFG